MLIDQKANYLKNNINIFENVYKLWAENPNRNVFLRFDIELDKSEIDKWQEICNKYKNFVFEIDLITMIAQQINSNETFLNTLQRIRFNNIITQSTDNQIIIKYYSFLSPIFELDFE